MIMILFIIPKKSIHKSGAAFTLKIDSEVLGTKKEKIHHGGASTLVWEKSPNGALNYTKGTFLQNRNDPHVLKSTQS